MKHKTNITNSRFRYLRGWILSVLFLLYALFLPTPIALAQNEPDVIDQPYNINGKEVKQYLVEKYELKKHDVTSTLKQTLYGPEGKVHIRGDIASNNATIAQGINSREDRARAIARAFMEEEVNLFGITNMEEVREIWIDTFMSPYTNLTTINIHYRRYINDLELKDMYIQITIGPDENIRSVNSELVSVPPELYQAVTKKTLSEAEIRRIVVDDIKTNPAAKKTFKDIGGTTSLELKKVATSSPPYIIWKVKSVWEYVINAFTGEILEKHSRIRY